MFFNNAVELFKSSEFICRSRKFKFFVKIRNDLFRSFEDLPSGRIKTGSTQAGFFVLGGLRKKSLARCQILRSKFYLYTIQQKVFFNITKDSYRSYVRVKSQNMFLGRKNFCSEWSEKQVLSTMSGFALKILSLNSLTKSFFLYSEGLIQIISVPMKVSENPYIFYGRRIFCSRWSEKKNLARCQILRSKYYLYTVHEKVFFNIVKDSFKSYRSYVRVKSQNMFLGRKSFCSEWSEKQVLSTMSVFALKILSLYSLRKKNVFQNTEGLIQIIRSST